MIRGGLRFDHGSRHLVQGGGSHEELCENLIRPPESKRRRNEPLTSGLHIVLLVKGFQLHSAPARLRLLLASTYHFSRSYLPCRQKHLSQLQPSFQFVVLLREIVH
jgi:hypothetical protein